MRNCAWLIGLLLTLLCPVSSFAEITMFVSPDGDGAYIVEGDNAQGVQAIDITIGYDTASLATPRVEAQGGTATNVSADTPGMLAVSIFRENPDASFELHVKFDKQGNLPGVINYVAATAIDTDGKNYAASSDTRALTPPPTTPPEPGPTPSPPSDSGATDASRDGDILRELVDATPAAGNAVAPGAPGPAPQPEKPEKDRRTTGDGDKGEGLRKSVLDRFAEFRGKKGLAELTSLFERTGREGIVQEPAIAISDGKAPVTVTLEVQSAGVHAPDFSVTDAKLVALRKAGEKSWVITALPNEGTWQASLILRQGSGKVEFPLVVAPSIRIEKGINEKNFCAALEKYVAAQAAGQKWERGLSRRHLHEYIFIANYLAKLSDSATK